MVGYVYTVSRNNIPFYVGSTINLKARKNEHLYNAASNVSFDVIEEIEIDGRQDARLLKLEYHWIGQLLNWGFVLENLHGNKTKKKKIIYTNGVRSIFNSELFATMVKEKRSRDKYSIRDVAAAAEITNSTVCRIEKMLPVELKGILGVCDWLGRSVCDFIIYEKKPQFPVIMD